MKINTSNWESWVLEQTGASALFDVEEVQELWNGYGQLLRVYLKDSGLKSVILKRVLLPKGLEQTTSHQRKLRSYQVERAWYKHYAPNCADESRVAACYGVKDVGETAWLLLEDLAQAGFRPNSWPNYEQTESGLNWLAHFHSRFLGEDCPELWSQGCYWHLDTRMDELERMPHGPLKEKAEYLDQKLRNAQFPTLVHGDAKPPNFCWDSENRASAVDFQYVGGGCGIRDVALFLDRALSKDGCSEHIEEWLDFYFDCLAGAMRKHNKHHFEQVESEWRSLFPVAWADYGRFRQGWANTDTMHPFTAKMLEMALV